MAVAGGIILWLVLVGIIVGYFIVKKIGDKKEPHLSFDEKRVSNNSDNISGNGEFQEVNSLKH